MIPQQLWNEDFRFCLIRKQSKAPFEKAWQENGYKYNDTKLLNHINEGGNYGVIGGYGNLIILDKDKDELPIDINTLCIQTGSGGKHYYILSDYDTNHVFINEMGELRAKNYQCVGAGSTHPNGNKYEILKDVPIKFIPKEELYGLIKPYLREENTSISTGDEKSEKKDTSRSGLEYRKILALLRQGHSRAKIYKEMDAYSKWSSSEEQYKSYTFEKAENFYLQEIEKTKPEQEKPTVEIDYKQVYNDLISILKTYCDLKPEYYPIIALWIIGTYNHNDFPTYPYLFFNATRGSGKSRILNLISHLAYNGKLVSNVSEAVLFRTARNRTLCIDEFESVGSKDKSALRELLNSAYKKGMCVERTVKKRDKDGEKYQIESFDVYCPIVMANIFGVEDVLSDRCITLILEKSTNQSVTRLVELFEQDPLILSLKEQFGVGCVVYDALKTLILWNTYTYTTHTLPTNNITNTNIHLKEETPPFPMENEEFFKKVSMTELQGRNLELFFPLLIIAERCGVLDEVIPIIQSFVSDKKEEDLSGSLDISFLNYIANRESSNLFVPLRVLVQEFKQIEDDNENINPEWAGRALKRLGLILQKRRVRLGMELIIDYEKAKLKLRMFK